jgi:hypothetical protein
MTLTETETALLTPTDQLLAEKASAIRALAENVVRDIIEIERHLIEVKIKVGHGHYLEWLEHELRWSDRTASRFVSVHQFAVSKSAKLADLENIEVSGLYLLAPPSTPAPAAIDLGLRAASQSGRGRATP